MSIAKPGQIEPLLSANRISLDNYISKTPLTKKVVEKKVAFKELFRYSTHQDRIMMIIGLLAAIIAGSCYPLTTYAL